MAVTKERTARLIRAAQAWEQYGLDLRTAVRRIIAQAQGLDGPELDRTQLLGAIGDLVSEHMLPDHEHSQCISAEAALSRVQWARNERAKRHMARRRSIRADTMVQAWIAEAIEATSAITPQLTPLTREQQRAIRLGLAKERELATQDELQPPGMDAAEAWTGDEPDPLDIDEEPES